MNPAIERLKMNCIYNTYRKSIVVILRFAMILFACSFGIVKFPTDFAEKSRHCDNIVLTWKAK